MHVRRLVLPAFGPFSGRSWDFAPGLNVVWGPNEAGKSSLHAAFAVAVAGTRRGGGGQRKADKLFRQRHAPWGRDDWAVRAEVVCTDGTVLAVVHDLARRTGTVVELDTGRERTTEFLHDGGIDLSTLTGLDRDAFMSTACVRQADLLAICDDAAALQEHMQRAAAGSGTDATAARALEALADFFTEAVGPDRANSRRPLRRAKQAVEEAREELAEAQARHTEWLELVGRSQRLAHEVGERRTRLTICRAAVAVAEADERLAAEQARAAEIAALEERLHQLEARAAEVGAALGAIDAARTLRRALDRRAVVEREQAALADTERALAGARHELDEVERRRRLVQAVAARRLAAEAEAHLAQLEALAARHPTAPPPLADIDEQMAALLAALEEKPAPVVAVVPAGGSPGSPLARVLLVGGGVALVVGLVLAVAVAPALGLLAAGGIALVAAGLRLRSAAGRAESPVAETSPPEVRLSGLRERLAELERERDARRRAHDEWDRLHRLLDGRTLDDHRAECARLRREAEEASSGLDPAALADPALRAGPDAVADLERRRGELGERIARLEDELAERRAAAADPAAADNEVAGAREALDQALATAPAAWEVIDPDRLPEGAELARIESGERAELRRLEDEAARVRGTLDERRRHTPDPDAARAAADAARAEFEAVASLDPDTAAELTPRPGRGSAELAAEAAALTERLDRLEAEADRVQGRLAERSHGATDLPAAREKLAAAEDELARVERLRQVLQLTRNFLQEAQDRVHRDIAPHLRGTLEAWLPLVFDGRYTRVAVDPATLEVRVGPDDGDLQVATLLSHGTAEQVYLLLRVALVEHLTQGAEPCPLLLDEITAHADDRRAEGLLRLLRRLAAEGRQIVLFTQETRVRDWARGNLDDSRHRLCELDGPAGGVPAGGLAGGGLADGVAARP